MAHDSTWAPAWAGLAESRALLPYYGPGRDEPQVPPDSAYWARHLDAAEDAARRALELDPENASATVALGNVLRDRWDWEPAEAAYIRALTLDPDNFEAHQQYAEFLAYVGRAGEGLRSARRALALDRSPIRLNVAGYIALEDARFHEAIDYIIQGIGLDEEKRIPWLRGNLLLAYINAGRWPEAREFALGLIREVSPAAEGEFLRTWPAGPGIPADFDPAVLTGSPVFHDAAGAFWMAQGRPGQALAFLEEGLSRAPPFAFSGLLFYPEYDSLPGRPQVPGAAEVSGPGGETAGAIRSERERVPRPLGSRATISCGSSRPQPPERPRRQAPVDEGVEQRLPRRRPVLLHPDRVL